MRKVAIVATSFRMPGTSPAKFWDDLLAGRDLVTQVDPTRFGNAAYLHPNKSHPGTAYTFAAGTLGDISGFDAGFFAISPREACLMDPQQRLLMEMSWETFENAGIQPSSLRGSNCGVYIGISAVDYSWRLSEDLAAVDASFATGNTSSIAANRLSYFYDLRGPSMAIDTACSSSMVAFHQACRAIASGEVRQALAGAISLHLHPLGFVSFSKASMLSRQGRCRVFDAAADGYVRSEGGGVFFLKDLEQAIADGNPILAVVAHTAVNTDGHKSGLTVPSISAQAELLKEAYRHAQIEPWEIDYIEAHGTGTAVGDPIESRALGEALGRLRPKSQPLLIGSVKGNVGHLEAASGIAGLVKALHCLRHRVVPAHVGMDNPNPRIPFDDLNLEVLTANKPLPASGRLIIGVNSFGFGGANAHVILESYAGDTVAPPALGKASALPILVSARDAAALTVAARELAAFVKGQPQSALYDIAYASVYGRERHPYCALLFGKTPAATAAALLRFADGGAKQSGVEFGAAVHAPRGAAFVYSGNGAQWAGMGAQLLANAVFKGAVREVDRLFSRYADYSLEAELAGRNGEGRYARTEYAQPAMFALQVGITAMLRSRGIEPVAVAGHSVGEVAAAWASGALTLAAAVSVIHHRSALQGLTKGSGHMLAVVMGEAAARDLLAELGLADELAIASVNSSRGVTVAGNAVAVARFEAALELRKVGHKQLGLDYAFHTAAMDGLHPELRRALAHLEPDEAETPFYSAVTGEKAGGKSLNADYWWRNIREPVRFHDAIAAMVRDGINIFIEVGPHAALRRYVQDTLADADVTGCVTMTSMRSDGSVERVHAGANQAVIAGAAVEWQRLLPWRGRHVRLPNYPWQKERFWHPVTSDSLGQLDRHSEHPLLGYASARAELTWENTLDTLKFPLLADHVVGGATVFPGAGHVELALAAALHWQPGDIATVEDIEIRAPLLLGEEPSRALRCSLDASDGQLAIESREQLGTEPWTLHVVGRVLREAADLRLQVAPLVVPLRPVDFTAASHAELVSLAGLTYGPAFRAVSHGWTEAKTLIAALEVPAGVDADLAHYHVHPALLDSTFQLIIQLLRDTIAAHAHNGMTFVPTRVGQVTYRKGLGKPRYARVRLLSHAPHSVCAEFELFDAAAQPIAVLQEVRFRAIRLQHAAADPMRYFDYVAVPRPFPCPAIADAVAALPELDAGLAAGFADPDVQRAHAQYALEVDPLLDELCNRFVLEALQAAPVAAADARDYQIHLLARAQADGLLDGAADAPGTAQDIWNSLLGDYPDYSQMTHAVGSVGMHLAALLRGDRTLAQVQPSQASLPALLRRARGGAFRNRLEAAVLATLRAALAGLPEGRRLGIVEIGAGTPVLAPAIGRTLDFDRGDLRFVSSVASTLEEAGRLREKHPALEVAALQASTGDGTSTLAVVWQEFCSLDEALRALDYACAQLAAGGKLVLIGQHPTRWLDFVFGRDPAWWTETAEGLPLSNQQPAAFWQERLQRLGFGDLRLDSQSNDAASGAYLLVGTKGAAAAAQPAVAAARHWLLVTDADGYAARLGLRLGKELEAQGQLVQRIAGCADAAFVGALEQAGSAAALDGIVFLSGLKAVGASAAPGAVLDVQVARCAAASALVKAAELTRCKAECIFVTADTASHLLPSRPRDASHASGVADAPLAGLVRTLLNEAAEAPLRLIDVETAGAAVDCIAALLAQELLTHDAEQEIILSADAARYAPRLRAAAAPLPAAPATGAATPHARLGFAIPGQLRNLQWMSYTRVPPRDDQVEVSVRATGLNFRDVMYALGLLSDEAVEHGFAGPTLGLEFSGVVTGVGARAAGFAPGDAVVGFAPSSFGDLVVTRAGALAHLPAGFSFEAAATVPSTFFTAYYALHHLARLGEDERVLIHGAAGGVGIAAIQVAKWCGAEIYATAGSDEKRDFLRLLGVTHIFDSRSLSFADEILAATGGHGVDVVLNSLAGEAINRNLRVLKPFGRFLELGKRDFYENTRVGLRPFRNNLSFFGIDADQLMVERPDLTQRLFAEVLDLMGTGVLRPLPYCAFDAADVVDAFRHMQQSRHIGKIVVTYGNDFHEAPPARPAVVQRPRLELPAQATYLVTGGLGGFGLRTAEWLAERGARQLVLIGRRGERSIEAQAAIKRLEERGVRVATRACDVTDRAALATLLDDIARGMPPLRGIVHAAMVIEDGLIRDSGAAQLRRVLAPKILGALHLHELTRALPLDFFVLYSSATTLFGNPGQGSYVAANAALEALARERRAAGLCATSVLWGAIDDVGYLARNPKIKEALQNRMGGSALPAAAALDALERMLVADRSGLGVLELEWRALSRFLPSASTAKFGELARDCDGGGCEEGTADLRRLLGELSGDELLDTVIDLLKEEVGEILRMAPTKIDSNLSVQQMGLDSLMGVELVVAVESRFGTRLPVMALSDSPTIAKLAVYIIKQLHGDEAANADSVEDEARAAVERVAAQHASALPQADMDQVVGTLRSGTDAARRMIH